MTLRGRWADIFWYSLLHELGHILLHDKRQTFLENGEPTSESLEHEANRFAANTLIPPRPYEEFVATGVLTAASIRKFGESIAIAPGIVVGRLQHEKRLAPNALNGLRPRWAFQPPERNLGN
jgi:HTH-type transcriptional regulator/antitoxin HigA